MLSDAAKRLREDKRLYRRNGWMESEELSAQLEALPDVSHKCAAEEDVIEGDASGAVESTDPS